MDDNEKDNNTKTQSEHIEDINVSLGTTVFIAVLSAIAFLAFVVWISLRIEGLA